MNNTVPHTWNLLRELILYSLITKEKKGKDNYVKWWLCELLWLWWLFHSVHRYQNSELHLKYTQFLFISYTSIRLKWKKRKRPGGVSVKMIWVATRMTRMTWVWKLSGRGNRRDKGPGVGTSLGCMCHGGAKVANEGDRQRLKQRRKGPPAAS